MTYCDGALVIGDHPVIGVLRGDGIGLVITPVMRTVVDAAVTRAFGGGWAGRTSRSCPAPASATPSSSGC